MSLKNISTKFKEILREDDIIVYKAVDDTIYQIVEYRWNKIKTSRTIVNIYYMSEDKYKWWVSSMGF